VPGSVVAPLFTSVVSAGDAKDCMKKEVELLAYVFDFGILAVHMRLWS
jgi:hypothetical protein